MWWSSTQVQGVQREGLLSVMDFLQVSFGKLQTAHYTNNYTPNKKNCVLTYGNGLLGYYQNFQLNMWFFSFTQKFYQMYELPWESIPNVRASLRIYPKYTSFPKNLSQIYEVPWESIPNIPAFPRIYPKFTNFPENLSQMYELSWESNCTNFTGESTWNILGYYGVMYHQHENFHI